MATTDSEDLLLRLAKYATAADVEHLVRGWRDADLRAGLRGAELHHARRGVSVAPAEDGSYVVRGRLAPEVGALLLKALEAARERLYREREQRPLTERVLDRATPTQRNADALALLAESALHQGLDPGAPGERYQVTVIVSEPVLQDASSGGECRLQHQGPRVPPETAQRLACDAGTVVVKEGAAGNILAIGARTRTIPPAIRRALLRRDRHCRFPGCPFTFNVDGHHIVPWAQGGPTTLANLVRLCRRHHRAVHEQGYRVERLDDGTLRFRRPGGRELPAVPERGASADELVDALLEWNAEAGVEVDADARLARDWTDEPVDLGYAVDVGHPAANPRENGSAEPPSAVEHDGSAEPLRDVEDGDGMR